MAEKDSVQQMWDAFVAARPNLVPADACYSAWHFCDNQSDADELAELVLVGQKCATAGALAAYEAEGDPLPKVGDISIITNWAGEAQCVIRTNGVDVVPFDQVTPEFAAAEGEGDGTLEYWRAAHEAAFSRELEGTGITPDGDMLVVCEYFEVVFAVN